jgi:hypothetical protein
MTQTYHTPIINGDERKNDAAIWNDPLGELDAQLVATNADLETTDTRSILSASEIAAARGAYDDLDSRLDALVLAGGAGATGTLAGNTLTVTVTVGTGEADAFSAGAPVVYIVDGVAEYGTIASASGATITLDDAPSGQIDSGTLISQISQSEYEAAISISYGGTFSPTLPRTMALLERQVNIMGFGAFGDDSSHVIGAPALATAQAQYPLTHAEYVITAADEYDWCAIQEAILAADAQGATVEDVFIPAGDYYINRTIIVPVNDINAGRTFVISGGGFRGTSGTNLIATGAITLFHVPGQTTLRRLTLTGDDITNSDSIAIRIGGTIAAGDPWDMENSTHVTLEYIRFGAGWYDCIHSLWECDQLHISHCTAFGSVGRAAVYLYNDVNTNGISPSAGVVIEQCVWNHTSSTTSGDCLYGVYLLGTEGSVIRNSTIRGYDHIIYLDGLTGTRNYGLIIDGVHSEINQDLKTYTSERWTPNTAYALNDIIRPMAPNGNGWWYKCTTAGTTAANSVRTAAYRWVVSARGTTEYYLELAAGGDPSITEPFGVMENGTPMTFAFAGRLTAGQWGYGDNDSLGFTTIYVRLTDSTDPDSKALHYVWTSTNEPTWPTTYSSTVADSGAVWTAYKRSVFCETAASSSSVHGGLRISGCYANLFSIFININSSTNDTVKIAVDRCSILLTDMIYRTNSNIRAALFAENSQLDGCIKPYATLAATTGQTSVILRFCSRLTDYTGALGSAVGGTATWLANNSGYERSSEAQVNDVNTTIDLVNLSQIMVATGSSASALLLYVPRLTSAAWLAGLKGRKITIVHATGTDTLTLTFNSNQPVLYNNGTPTTIAMAEIGDAVTIQMGVTPSGVYRWILAGSYGV